MKLNRNSKLVKYLLFVLLLIPFALFVILYYISKITRSLSYLCLFKIDIAKQEIKDFWSIETTLGDAF